MTNGLLSRRRILATSGTALAGGIAGCSQDVDPSDDSSTDAETVTPDPRSSYREATIEEPRVELDWIDGAKVDLSELAQATRNAVAGYRPQVLDAAEIWTGQVEDIPPTVSGFDTELRYEDTIEGQTRNAFSYRIDFDQGRQLETSFHRFGQAEPDEWGIHPWDFGRQRETYLNQVRGYSRNRYRDGESTPEYSNAATQYPEGVDRAMDETHELIVDWIQGTGLDEVEIDHVHEGPPFKLSNTGVATDEGESITPFGLGAIHDVSAEVDLGSWVPIRHIEIEGLTENDEQLNATFELRAGHVDVQEPEWLSIAKEEV